MTARHIAERLGKTGYCVCPGFLSADSLRDTRGDLDRIKRAGHFHRAGVGQGRHLQSQNSVRRDEIFWLDRGLDNPIQELLWQKMDLLKRAFNRTLFLGLLNFEGHYAAYPEGGFYKRHRDCFRDDSDRMVSLVLYLNRDWKSHDGGRLRIFSEHSHTDVDPVGGTMVCFMSRESEHEVLLSHEKRFSFTGWFKVRGVRV